MSVLTNLDNVLKIKKALFGYVSVSIDFHRSFTKDKMILACISWIFCFFHYYQKIHFIFLFSIGVKYSQNISLGFLVLFSLKGKKKKKSLRKNIQLFVLNCIFKAYDASAFEVIFMFGNSYLFQIASSWWKDPLDLIKFKFFGLGIWQKSCLFLTIF